MQFMLIRTDNDTRAAATDPQAVLEAIPESRRLRLPMRPGHRSLNQSNAVAVMVFEAWRQAGFPGDALAAADRSEAE